MPSASAAAVRIFRRGFRVNESLQREREYDRRRPTDAISPDA